MFYCVNRKENDLLIYFLRNGSHNINVGHYQLPLYHNIKHISLFDNSSTKLLQYFYTVQKPWKQRYRLTLHLRKISKLLIHNYENVVFERRIKIDDEIGWFFYITVLAVLPILSCPKIKSKFFTVSNLKIDSTLKL